MRQCEAAARLELQAVSLAYGEKRVLDRLTLAIPAGSRTVIMGPSGCGKTTLLRVLSGLAAPTEGQVLRTGAAMSWVFQENRLAEDYSAVANLRMIGPGRGPSREEALEVLRALGLDRRDSLRPVRLLSGGMKRRVAIGRALLSTAGVLFLDEPFAGLDDEARDAASSVILQRWENRTLLCVSHEAEDARRLAATVLGFSRLSCGGDGAGL